MCKILNPGFVSLSAPPLPPPPHFKNQGAWGKKQQPFATLVNLQSLNNFTSDRFLVENRLKWTKISTNFPLTTEVYLADRFSCNYSELRLSFSIGTPRRVTYSRSFAGFLVIAAVRMWYWRFLVQDQTVTAHAQFIILLTGSSIRCC